MSRAVQPKCPRCNHSRSFHDDGVGRCFAMGCRCEHMPTLRERLDSLTRDDVREVARRVEVPNYSTIRANKGLLVDALVSLADHRDDAEKFDTILRDLSKAGTSS